MEEKADKKLAEVRSGTMKGQQRLPN